MTTLDLHHWAALERAGHLRQSAESHQPVTTAGNKWNSLVARIALSLVGVVAVAGVVGLGRSTLAVQPAGLSVYRPPVVPNVVR